MGGNPLFLLSVIFVFYVKELVYFCNNSFVSFICCFVVPRRVTNAKLVFIFGTALGQIAVRHRLIQ